MVTVAYAFTKDKKGGNPAGVVLLKDTLSITEMQHIATKVNLSETAFIKPIDTHVFDLQFFTPVSEVDLCGHATIASFTVLKDRGLVKDGHYTQITKAGALRIEIQKDAVFMEMAKPSFHQLVDRKRVADSLGLSEQDLVLELPVQCVSTGLKDILIPVKSITALESITPQFKAIEEVSRDYEAVGYHVFCYETGTAGHIRVRNFAPLYAIDEEAATGTANGALLAYLKKYNLLNPGITTFTQGVEMNSPSEILGYFTDDDCIYIGGQAMVISEMH